MPTAAANLTARVRAKPENSGSSSAARISRTRSARKLKHSTPSPSCMPAVVADHRRQDELVGLLRARRRRRSPPAASAKRGALGLDHRVVGLRHALPALVAVHRVVAAAARSRPARDVGSAAAKRCEIVAGRLRRRVAAVGEGVHHDRHAGVGEDLGQRRRHGPGANARRRARPGPSGGRCRRSVFSVVDQAGAAPAPARSRRRRWRRRCAAGPASPRGRRRC